MSLILGNDLAGGKVLINPKMTAVPLPACLGDLEQKNPGVFSVSVTRATREAEMGFGCWKSGRFN